MKTLLVYALPVISSAARNLSVQEILISFEMMRMP